MLLAKLMPKNIFALAFETCQINQHMKTISPAELLRIAATRQNVSPGDLKKRYEQLRKVVKKSRAKGFSSKSIRFTHKPQPGELDVSKMEFK